MFASSRYVHRNWPAPKDPDEYSPFTSYGESKVRGEVIVKESGLTTCWSIVRPTSIWGPWFRIPYRNFFDAVRKGLYVHPDGVKILKSYGFVLNSVHQIRAIVLGAPEAVGGRVFYLADYDPLDVFEWANAISRSFGAPKVRSVPLWVLRALAKAGDLGKACGMYNPPLSSFRLENLLTQMVYDTSETEKVVGHLPYCMSEGVQITTDWMRSA